MLQANFSTWRMFGYGIEVISILIVINRCLLHRHTEINILHLGGSKLNKASQDMEVGEQWNLSRICVYNRRLCDTLFCWNRRHVVLAGYEKNYKRDSIKAPCSTDGKCQLVVAFVYFPSNYQTTPAGKWKIFHMFTTNTKLFISKYSRNGGRRQKRDFGRSRENEKQMSSKKNCKIT